MCEEMGYEARIIWLQTGEVEETGVCVSDAHMQFEETAVELIAERRPGGFLYGQSIEVPHAGKPHEMVSLGDPTVFVSSKPRKYVLEMPFAVVVFEFFDKTDVDALVKAMAEAAV